MVGNAKADQGEYKRRSGLPSFSSPICRIKPSVVWANRIAARLILQYDVNGGERQKGRPQRGIGRRVVAAAECRGSRRSESRNAARRSLLMQARQQCRRRSKLSQGRAAQRSTKPEWHR